MVKPFARCQADLIERETPSLRGKGPRFDALLFSHQTFPGFEEVPARFVEVRTLL